MATIIGANIYVGGIKRNTNPVSLTGTFNLSAWYNPGSNVSVQATFQFDDGTESEKSNIQQFQLASDLVQYDPLYQAVLDQATADGVGHPTLSQNLSCDTVARSLRAKNLLDNDLFYYFQQDEGTPYEFLTYNWMYPSKHRLTNAGANPVQFVGGQGMKVSGGNGQHFNTNYVPSIDAVHAIPGDVSLVFKGFEPLTSNTETRIFGGRGAEGKPAEINVYRSVSTSVLLMNVYGELGYSAIINDDFKRQLTLTQTGNSQSYYKDSQSTGTFDSSIIAVEKTSVPLHIFALNVNGTFYPSSGQIGLKYLMFGPGRTQEQIDDINNILNFGRPVSKSEPGVLKIDSTDTTLASIYFPEVQLSSDFPTVNTTKKYIITYSTDHAPMGSAGIGWGECDDLQLNGFIERGIIAANNYQPETPCLRYDPDAPEGERVRLYFHTDANDPENDGYQQTHLWTRAGGDLHEPTGWTPRGKVLGMIDPGNITASTEQHTGYLMAWKQPDGTWVGIHHTKGFVNSTIDGINRFGKSTSPDGINWTRVTSRIDNTSFMPLGRLLHLSPAFYFTRNGQQYTIGMNINYSYSIEGRTICIVKCDNNDYLPTEVVANISANTGGDEAKITNFKIDPLRPDTLNIFYLKTNGNQFTDPGNEMYHSSWDLTRLDS